VASLQDQPRDLAARVLTLARERALWSPGQRLLVALSGGPDSVTLLHVLAGLAPSEELDLFAAHVNYGLRGAESDGDEAHCRDLCATLDIPLAVMKSPQAPAGNVQAWARRMRRRWFRELAHEQSCDRIATGHTANDRAETVVLQWLRGAARRGAANMQPRSGALIRPLLTTTRAEIEAYLKAKGVAFRTDSTNDTPRYRRNRVRHEVLPLLSDVFGVDAVAALSTSADLYGIEADFLEQEAAQHEHLIEPAPCGLKIPLAPLAELHPALALLVLKRATAQLGVRPRRDRLFRLLDLASRSSGKRLRLGPHATAERGRDHVWLYASLPALAETCIRVPGVTVLPDGSRLLVEPLARRSTFPRGDYQIAATVANTDALHVRPARAGDRIRPFGSGGSRLVFDLLSEAGVPRYLRSRSWVLEDKSRILWLLGLRPAEETRVLPDSREVYQFRWESEGPREKLP
jgi:tRNA(Ile)-lysidine synthase